MNEMENKLFASLAQITAEHEKLTMAHTVLGDELGSMKTAMKDMSNGLADSANKMVELSYYSLNASINLHNLLLATNSASAIDPPSTTDIATARSLAIETAQSVALAANVVAEAAQNFYAYMHAPNPR